MKYLGYRAASISPSRLMTTGGAIWTWHLPSRTNNLLDQGFGCEFLRPLNHTVPLFASSCSYITLVPMIAAVNSVSTTDCLCKANKKGSSVNQTFQNWRTMHRSSVRTLYLRRPDKDLPCESALHFLVEGTHILIHWLSDVSVYKKMVSPLMTKKHPDILKCMLFCFLCCFFFSFLWGTPGTILPEATGNNRKLHWPFDNRCCHLDTTISCPDTQRCSASVGVQAFLCAVCHQFGRRSLVWGYKLFLDNSNVCGQRSKLPAKENSPSFCVRLVSAARFFGKMRKNSLNCYIQTLLSCFCLVLHFSLVLASVSWCKPHPIWEQPWFGLCPQPQVTLLDQPEVGGSTRTLLQGSRST